MSRFHKYSRYSTAQLAQQRQRMAERLAGGLLLLLLGCGVLAILCPSPKLFREGDHCHFHGVPYTEKAQPPVKREKSPQGAIQAIPHAAAPSLRLPLTLPAAEITLLLPPEAPQVSLDTDAPTEDFYPEIEGDSPPHAEISDAPQNKRFVARKAGNPPPALQAPAYLHTPAPPYPPALKRRRIEGSVGLRIHVSASGAPTTVEITAPSPHREFNTTARYWVRRHWVFTPARQKGQCVPGIVNTHIIFTLAASEHP
ncbi:MAG: energy transducer TonB [Akkermansia sp.]|nr:energy transducer TonB [Akkermansia sp.]